MESTNLEQLIVYVANKKEAKEFQEYAFHCGYQWDIYGKRAINLHAHYFLCRTFNGKKEIRQVSKRYFEINSASRMFFSDVVINVSEDLLLLKSMALELHRLAKRCNLELTIKTTPSCK